MQAVQLAFIQKIVKMLTPSSPAYNNSLAFEKPTTPHQIEQMLHPGDIIFSRTNSHIYEMARKYMGIAYDHVAVVLNQKQVIHISPPIISKIDIGYIVDPKRQPMIIRPKLENIERFMLVLNNYLGEHYNTTAIAKIGLRELKNKLKTEEKAKFSLSLLKHSRICSDSVLYSLIRGSPSLQAAVVAFLPQTKFQQLGFFMPDEIANILLDNDSELLLKSKFQEEYKIVDIFSKGGQKAVVAAQKIVQVSSFCSNKWREKMEKHKKKDKMVVPSKFSGVQLFSLILGLGHTLGVVTLTNSWRFLMLMLNLVIILGHYQEFKAYLNGNYPHL